MNNIPSYDEVVDNTVVKALSDHPDGRLFFSIVGDLRDNYYAEYFQQDNFYVAALVDRETSKTHFVGVSKRNTIDRPNSLRGRALALSRAVKALVADRLNSSQHHLELRVDLIEPTVPVDAFSLPALQNDFPF